MYWSLVRETMARARAWMSASVWVLISVFIGSATCRQTQSSTSTFLSGKADNTSTGPHFGAAQSEVTVPVVELCRPGGRPPIGHSHAASVDGSHLRQAQYRVLDLRLVDKEILLGRG